MITDQMANQLCDDVRGLTGFTLAHEDCRTMLQRILENRPSLTPKMKATLDYIRGYIERKGVGPTFGEIAINVGFNSKARVAAVISCLEERGYISRLPKQSRSISIVGG